MWESVATASNPPSLQSFLIAFRRAVQNLLALLEFAASSSPYHDALSTR
jgi:hypothetical protein